METFANWSKRDFPSILKLLLAIVDVLPQQTSDENTKAQLNYFGANSVKTKVLHKRPIS